MELVRDRPQHPHYIRAYEDGALWVGQTRYAGSVLITATEIMEDWPPSSLGELEIAHFEPVMARPPEIVILGTGPVSRMPSPKLLVWFNGRGIGFEAMTTDAACRTFNILLEEGRDVVAALIVHP